MRTLKHNGVYHNFSQFRSTRDELNYEYEMKVKGSLTSKRETIKNITDTIQTIA